MQPSPGYHGDVNNFYYLQEWLQEAHPGQYMNSINLFNGDTNSTKVCVVDVARSCHPNLTPLLTSRSFSFLNARSQPMYEQVAGVIAYIENATQADGLSQYHLVCHSQGGLVCRAVLEMFNGHNVSNFVSMAGVGMRACVRACVYVCLCVCVCEMRLISTASHIQNMNLRLGNGFFGGADTFFGHVETDLAWLYMYTKAAQKSYR